jgi:outer membrane protein assembly factor BamB
VTDGEHLIVSFGSFGLYCYDLDGNRIWEKDLGKATVTWGEGSSPALAGNAVIVIQDSEGTSSLYAFDKRTGRELWKKPREEKSSWTTPFVLTRDGKTQVIVNGSTAVRSYDPQTGEVLWQCSGLGVNVTPMVVVDQNAVYAMSGQRTSPMAMAIQLGRSGDLTNTGAVLWKLNRGTPYVASPLLYDGLLYFFQHVTPLLTCVDAATGKPHYAQERLPGLSTVYASPIGVNNRVYITDLDGTTLVLEKSRELKILATNKLDDGFAASPAVVGNELFLRGRSHLYCITGND